MIALVYCQRINANFIHVNCEIEMIKLEIMSRGILWYFLEMELACRVGQPFIVLDDLGMLIRWAVPYSFYSVYF